MKKLLKFWRWLFPRRELLWTNPTDYLWKAETKDATYHIIGMGRLWRAAVFVPVDGTHLINRSRAFLLGENLTLDQAQQLCDEDWRLWYE